MCELCTYLASYKWLICGMSRMSQYIGNHSTKDSSTCVVTKLKALQVVRRDVMWQILRMDKCVCVVHLFYTSSLMPLMFSAFAHACHTRRYAISVVGDLYCMQVMHVSALVVKTMI